MRIILLCTISCHNKIITKQLHLFQIFQMFSKTCWLKKIYIYKKNSLKSAPLTFCIICNGNMHMYLANEKIYLNTQFQQILQIIAISPYYVLLCLQFMLYQ